MLVGQPTRKRGAVAIKTDFGDTWIGVYINDGSNPFIFGSQIWSMLQENWQGLERWAKSLLECGYWEEFLNDGICPYCGKYGVGQPHLISGNVLNKYRGYGPDSMAPDPNCSGHTHLPAMPTLSSVNEERDGLWIEWAYVLDVKTYSLEIFRAVRAGGTVIVTQPSLIVNLPGLKRKQPKYRYFPMGIFNLMGDEPDWNEIERKGLNVSKYYHNKFQRCKKTIL